MGGHHFRTYRVAGSQRQPLLEFVIGGLRDAGCRIVHEPASSEAPFRLVLETAWGERIGLVMYLFRSTMVPTRNRPPDEARFQVKYGPRTDELHPVFIDPYDLYITLFAGIDLEQGIIVAVDPEMHNPTRFFVSVEYKHRHAEDALRLGWTCWERDKRGAREPIEVLVACKRERILDLFLFERAARGLSPGHRQLLAERFPENFLASSKDSHGRALHPEPHRLLSELGLDVASLLNLIDNAGRLKMAVRGGVAEHHLAMKLRQCASVRDVSTIPGDGQPDLAVTLTSGRVVKVECKNCLRTKTGAGLPRVDFMRTRASKVDPCSRFYAEQDFDMLAACLHPVTQNWEFAFRLTRGMREHKACLGKLDNRVTVDGTWLRSFDVAVASLL